MIDHIQGTGISANYGCILAGLKEIPVENISVRNVNLTFDGGGKAEDSFRDIPENEPNYPNGRIFGVLPSYGFYIRHARNITLQDLHLRFLEEDERPAVICEDVCSLTIDGLMAGASPNTPHLIRLTDIKTATVSRCYPADPVPVFLSVQGELSTGIVLLNNRLKHAQVNLVLAEGVPEASVTEIGTIGE
jgi:hypothetical protein